MLKRSCVVLLSLLLIATDAIGKTLSGRIEEIQLGDKWHAPEEEEDVWLRVPNWAAGTWTTSTMQHFKNGVPIVTNISQEEAQIGTVVDALGNIWDYSHLPGTSENYGENRISHFVTFKCQMVALNDNSFEFRKDQLRVTCNKDGIVLKIQRLLDDCLVERQGQDHLKTTHHATGEFGEDVGVSVATKTSPFIPLEKLSDGRDAQAAFREFLRASGQSDLIPNNAATATEKPTP